MLSVCYSIRLKTCMKFFLLLLFAVYSPCVQMSQQHCGILQQCHTELKDGIDVESHVLDYLYSRSVITVNLSTEHLNNH